MSTKIWGTTYLASGYCWVQILMLWLGSGVVAVLVYGILHQVNDKTIASLQTGLRISDTLRTPAAHTCTRRCSTPRARRRSTPLR